MASIGIESCVVRFRLPYNLNGSTNIDEETYFRGDNVVKNHRSSAHINIDVLKSEGEKNIIVCRIPYDSEE